MSLNSLSSATYTNRSGQQYSSSAAANGSTIYDFWSVTTKDTDGTTGQEETSYTCDWSRWHGYYREVPQFSAVIDVISKWTIGKGFEANETIKKILNRIRGFGKDDFNTILENQIRTALICGDSFAEIIKDKAGRIINLKPLNPGSISIIVNSQGIIQRYEQKNQLPAGKQNIIFDVEEIFHLSWNRIADEIHGIPFAEKLENLVSIMQELQRDQRVMFHRYIKPIIIVGTDSNDPAEIAAFKTKMDDAYTKSEIMVVPKDVLGGIDKISVPQFSTLDPLPYLKYITRVFITACGVPEIIMGWGEGTTEASSKVIYVSFQQTIERTQLYIETQLKLQLNIELELNFPVSLDPNLQEDNKKDGPINSKSKMESKINESE